MPFFTLLESFFNMVFMEDLLHCCHLCRISYSESAFPANHILLRSVYYKDSEVFMTLCNNNLYVIQRGSDEIRDWLLNFWAVKKHIGDKLRIHRGFHNSFKRIKREIKRELEVRDFNKVIFTGHSKGGALSQIAAWYFSQWYEVECYTFASPRIGNKKFCQDLDAKVKNNYRVAIKSDIVPKVPKINYYHGGMELLLPKENGLVKSHSIDSYYHHLESRSPERF